MIFQFEDVNSYLKDYLRRLPHQGYGEARKIAGHLSVSSTYVSHILSGQKQLSSEQALSLTKYFGHNPAEAEYFLYLVQYDRAGTMDLKKFYSTKIKELQATSLKLVNRVEPNRNLTEHEKSIFYSSPLYSSIHIYCSTHKQGRSVDEIMKRFEISRSKSNEIIRFLVESNLVFENKNKYLTGTQSTHLEQSSQYLLKHHTNWRLRAVQAAENLNEKELMYTVNVALSEKDFGFLREEMVSFVENFLAKVHPSPSEEIACFNLDWFWIRK